MPQQAFIPVTPIPRVHLRLKARREPRRPTCTSADNTQAATLPTSSSKPAVSLSPLENNTFTLETESTTLLIDPWLNDDLVFLTPSFFRASKPPPRSRALDYRALDVSAVSAIVLTQGLPDHAHPPTLARLPRDIPVVAPASAVALLRSLGYERILEVTYGDVVEPVRGGGVSITALRGSTVGPPWSDAQLAYVFSFGRGDARTRVYHEPHGNHDVGALQGLRGEIDAVIAPVVATCIPALANYALVNGVPEALQLCRAARPRTCVTFDNSKGRQTGLLTRFLKMEGGVERFLAEVAADDALRDMRVVRTDNVTEAVVIAGDAGVEQ